MRLFVRYSLRLLLPNVRDPLSFNDLLTVNETQYKTFKVAEHRGLLENGDSLKDFLRDTWNTHTSKALTRFFVTISFWTVYVHELWEGFSPILLEDDPTTSIPNNNINFVNNLNFKQKKAFDTIIYSIKNKANAIYFIDDSRGTIHTQQP